MATARGVAATATTLVKRSTPGSRSRSIWLTQLVTAGAIVVITVAVQALQPELFKTWTYASGVGLALVATATCLIVPWWRLHRDAVVAIPMADVIAIALLMYGSDLRFSVLWVFPLWWIATHFAPGYLAGALVGIVAALVGESALVGASNAAVLELIVVAISLSFLGLVTHLSARQTRAFKRLLRRQAERMQHTIERVSSQERRVSQMLNAIDIGIIRLSASGDVLAVNEAYTELYAIDRSTPTRPGRAVEYASRRGEALSELRRPLARASRGERLDDERVWLFDVTGNWHALSISTRVLEGLDDEPASTLLMVHDITALIEAERQKERLAAVVSHELRNPLTAVIGHAELALDNTDVAGPARDHLEVIENAGSRMQVLIGEILATARGGGAEPSRARSLTDVRRVLENSLESFQPTADARGVTLLLEGSDALRVEGDGFRLRQVFDNIVSNAIKYTPKDGAVVVEGLQTDEGIVVSIIDTGVGISEDDLPHIFTPYFRTTSAEYGPTPGTGLGMGIARDIVEDHGGRVEVESQRGLGTTVRIFLPTAGVPTAAPEESTGSSQ